MEDFKPVKATERYFSSHWDGRILSFAEPLRGRALTDDEGKRISGSGEGVFTGSFNYTGIPEGYIDISGEDSDFPNWKHWLPVVLGL